ncbi:MAG: hypothetical protein VW239_04145 [Candidatus Nanopelagicales bacterium]
MTPVRDVMGRPLEVGDIVVIAEHGASTHWRVESVTPMLAPQAPAGAVKLELVARVATHLQAGAQVRNFIRIATAEEIRARKGEPAEVTVQ